MTEIIVGCLFVLAMGATPWVILYLLIRHEQRHYRLPVGAQIAEFELQRAIHEETT